ncbi:MAG: putative nucleotidyltransferase substrate binding domain-containing protein [Thiotrichales bacterium]
MEIEDLEIRDFIAQCPPMTELDDSTINHLTAQVEITYIRRGTKFVDIGDHCAYAYLIRTGVVEVLDKSGGIHARFSEGEWVGVRCLLRDRIAQRKLKTLEDTLLYMIPAEDFLALLYQHADLLRFFSPHKPDRLREAMDRMRRQNDSGLIATQVKEYLNTDAVILTPATSIQKAAQQMARQNVSAVLVAEDEALTGIITEREFCTKVVAPGIDYAQPISTIMTPKPLTIAPEKSGAEAMLMMARNNIRHLPVVDNGHIQGLITATDLLKQQSHSAVFLVNSIYKSNTLDSLIHLSRELPKSLVDLVNNSFSAYDIGHAISSIGEALTVRLLKMAEDNLGPPPIPYAWIVAGSLSRSEQTAHSDQDNALFLDDAFEEQSHGGYFRALADFVSTGLNDCGYVYCPGNVMATNERWRQPVSVWKRYFREWIAAPDPKALMYTSIFFDLRCVHGNGRLLSEVQKSYLPDAPKNTIFLAHMASNALQYHPPLGLFRKFVLERGGAEEKALNLKNRGVVPVTDLARVYALACGSSALGTQDRLEAAADAGELSTNGMADLRDAFEFISTVRLQHQAGQISAGQEPDNFVSPEQLSTLERRHLKDAFEVVRTLQDAMKSKFHAGSFG